MKQTSLEVIEALYTAYPRLTAISADITAAAEAIITCYRQGGKLLTCGNGGSAADAGHIVGELMKGFLLRRPVPETIRTILRESDPQNGDYYADHLQEALPSISLVEHSALISAFSNDVAADMVFAQQVYGYGKAGDVLIGISTSGNSANVAHAIRVARALKLRTIGLTSEYGGIIKDICDISICVPATEIYAVQELHLPVYHALCATVEHDFFG